VEVKEPQSVLVMRFGAMGDVLLTTPALAALREKWPNTKIIYTTKKTYVDLIRTHPAIDEIVALKPDDKIKDFFFRLKEMQIDYVLDLHDKTRSKILRQIVPKNRQIVWQKRSGLEGLLVRLGLRTHQPKMHIAQRFHQAVEKMTASQLTRCPMRYAVDPISLEFITKDLEQKIPDAHNNIIGIAPAAKWVTKSWPEEHFKNLSRRLLEKGYKVVLVGSDKDKACCDAIAKAAPEAINYCDATNFAQLGALIGQCKVFIANDSGPMHMARALGIPTLAFFGSTSPKQFDFTPHQVLFENLTCSPCSLYGRKRCPYGHLNCLHMISVDDAWHAFEQLVTKPSGHFVCG
jgi:lipopolysaccharide heptosyltransferase II